MGILILGGGYAGLMTALRLANRGLGACVTLVNASPELVERVRNHELGAGKAPRRRAIAHLLRGTGVRFIVGRASRIDPERWTVHLAGGAELAFERLVVALGSIADDGGVPGVREHAMSVGDAAGAVRLRQALDRGARDIVVVGGGLTGIETAAEIAERGGRVTMVTSGPVAGFLSAAAQAYVHAAFARRGVRVLSTGIREVRAGSVALDHSELACDACVWAGGLRAPSLARESGLEVDEYGRILVDARLRSVSHPAVYAVGDAAAPRFEAGAPIRMGCKYAMPMGVHAADNLARSVAGERERPFRLGDSGFCVSLGRRDGLLQIASADGELRGIVTGRPAAWIKELIVRYTVGSMHLERLFAFYRWPQPPRLAAGAPAPSNAT